MSFVSVALQLVHSIGPDSIHHITLTECFATQLWRGQLYPRWCESVNAWLGSQVFVTYYPLSYYITSLFWPLHALGFSVAGVIRMSVWAAGVVSFMTVWWWLREVTDKKVALICAALYLWLPYRMEIMNFRPSLPEVWLMAFLPLLFYYARRLVQAPRAAWPALSILLGVCLLTQIPTTFCAVIILGLYAIIMSPRDAKLWIAYGFAVLTGLVLVLFYIVPAQYYQQFVPARMKFFMIGVWVTRTMRWEDVIDRPMIVFNFTATLIIFIAFAFFGWRRRAEITDHFLRREYGALLLCGFTAFVLLIPISEPFWTVWRLTGAPGMPWRMQAMVGIAFIYAVAVYGRWFISKKRRKTIYGDVGAAFVFLFFLALLTFTSYKPVDQAILDRIVAARAIQFGEYFSRWTERSFSTLEALTALHEYSPNRPLATVSPAVGKVQRAEWQNGNIQLDVDMKKPGAVAIEHFYYPMWRAAEHGGGELSIEPVQGSGRMRLSLPAGGHQITLSTHIYEGTWLLTWCREISLAAWVILIALSFRRRPGSLLLPVIPAKAGI